MHPGLPVYSANLFKHLDEFKPSIFIHTCNLSEGRLGYTLLTCLYTD